MLDRILIGSSAEPTDTNFKNVTLLLHGDGSNGAQNNTFIDSSTNNFTITRNGNTTQGSFSPYGSNWSNYFDGSGDYLTLGGESAFAFGTGDFTIEGWLFYQPTGDLQLFIDFRPSGVDGINPLLYIDTSGNLIYFTSGAPRITGGSLTANTWNHFAVSRSGTSTRLFINGTQSGSTYSDSNNYVVGASRPAIGSSGYNIGTLPFKGYLSNVRVLKGTALYTSTFTPPTQPLTAITNTSLLTCADNRFRDGSTNNFTITRNGDVKVTNFAPFAPSSAYSTTTNGGSAYFDGDDYLQISGAATGTGTWTVEGWFYFSSIGGGTVLSQGTADTSSCWFLYLTSSGGLNFYSNGDISASAGGVVRANTWVHIALVSNASNATTYVNGVSVATGSYSGKVFTGSPFQLNRGYGGATNGNICYQSDVRMVVGTAVYTSSFTPPSSPLTAISGTSLLVKGTNAAIFDNSMKNDLETVGNAQISTSVKKFGTGSMYFDGSGDYLSIPPTQEFSYGSGSFTVELWFYASSVSGSEIPIYKQHNSGAAAGDTVEIRLASSKVVGYIENTSFGGSTTLSANTWYHVAYVRNGSTCTLYLNGVSEGSATNSANLSTPTTVRVGTNQVASSFYTGYVDDVRVSKGIARYTANFTAPTAPFPNK